jgi:uncharacterized membrane protein
LNEPIVLFGHPIKKYLPFSFAAAVVYSIAAYIYILKADYDDLWILFAGNILFALVVTVFIFWLNRHYPGGISRIMQLISGGYICTIMALIISVLLCLAAFYIMSPGDITGAQYAEKLSHAPPQMISGNNGFTRVLFLDAIMGNAVAGFFVSVLFPFSAMRDRADE